jgi:hypothetical protein
MERDVLIEVDDDCRLPGVALFGHALACPKWRSIGKGVVLASGDPSIHPDALFGANGNHHTDGQDHNYRI